MSHDHAPTTDLKPSSEQTADAGKTLPDSPPKPTPIAPEENPVVSEPDAANKPKPPAL